MKDLAEEAYKAYSAHVNGTDRTWQALPYERLPAWARVGWNQAALAVQVALREQEDEKKAAVADFFGPAKSQRQETEQSAWDRMHPPGC